MSYVNPKLREQFEALPIALKDTILEQQVSLNTPEELEQAVKTALSGGYLS